MFLFRNPLLTAILLSCFTLFSFEFKAHNLQPPDATNNVKCHNEANGPIHVSATGGVLNCYSDSIQLTASSATPNLSYAWYDNGVLFSSEQNPYVSTVGSYTVVATAPNGCTGSAEASVIGSPNLPNVFTSTKLSCLSPDFPTFDFYNLFYWTNPYGDTLPPPAIVDTFGSYSFFLQDSLTGCDQTLTISFSYDSFPIEIFHFLSEPNAPGTILTDIVYGTPPYTYAWYLDGQVISTNPNAENLEEGIYNLIITDSLGCHGRAGPFEIGTFVNTHDLQKTKIQLFPNPTSNYLNILYSSNSEYELIATLFDSFGKNMENFDLKKSFTQLYMREFPKGIYFLIVKDSQTGKSVFSEKILLH